MYSMIRMITMRHSTKRRILRLSISPTSPHRESGQPPYSTAHLSPDFSGGLLRGCFYSTYPVVFCQLIHTHPDRLLQDEAELPKLPPLFFSAAGGVNSGGVDAAVTEDIREAHNVLETLIVRPGEEMAEIVG